MKTFAFTAECGKTGITKTTVDPPTRVLCPFHEQLVGAGELMLEPVTETRELTDTETAAAVHWYADRGEAA